LTIHNLFVGLRPEAPKAEQRLKGLQASADLAAESGSSPADAADLEFKKKAA